MGTLNPDFDGETVVVTGGTSGIGRRVALAFADASASVVVGDVDREPNLADTPTAEAITDRGGTATFVEADVTDRADLEALVETAGEFGGVDVMVNNAGIFVEGSILDLEPAAFDALHQVNAKGVYFGTQVAARDMLERDDPGAIVNTASISSSFAQFDQVQYDSTKGAVRMITRGSALELAEHGIRVNAVAPGLTGTELIEGWSEDAHQRVEADEMLKPVPLGRAGTPDDVAPAYVFLASDAADYVTGQMLYVDGGWSTF